MGWGLEDSHLVGPSIFKEVNNSHNCDCLVGMNLALTVKLSLNNCLFMFLIKVLTVLL